MGQVNIVLKRIFTAFNIFFAIVGGIILGLALLSQVLTSAHGGDDLPNRTVGLIVLYVVGSVTLVIAILGAYGAHKESKGCLIAFLVCMLIGGLLMIRLGIPAAVARPQLEDALEKAFRQFMPLDSAPDKVKEMANNLQSHMHCCGLFDYKDWEESIPDSCMCDQEAEFEGECKTINYMQAKTIYARPCLPILMHYVLLVADIFIGVILTLALLAVLGVILSSIMIHQMRYPNRPTVLLTVPAVFTTAPPKYQELHNPPSY